jgi:hypothetical protein
MLSVDFYESAEGETVVATFPDGGLGVIDAHPSSAPGRPTIADLIGGRPVHFVCLTHPHADHGVDLAAVFTSAKYVSSYWHTVSDVDAMIFSVTEQPKFPNRFSPLIDEMRSGWAAFLLELYRKAYECEDRWPGFIKTINSARQPIVISGVEVSFLGPEEAEQHSYVRLYRDLMNGKYRNKPDANLLSAVIALRYGPNVVLLGGDALKRNWPSVISEYRKRSLPKAVIFKIPHHGAGNAFSRSSGYNYLELCRPPRECNGIMFAGDPRHPNPEVFAAIKPKLNLMCLTNGLKPPGRGVSNPLNIALPGAQTVGRSVVCNPHIGFRLEVGGRVEQTAGAQCAFCA